MDRKAMALTAYENGNRVKAKFYAIGHLVNMGVDKYELRTLDTDELIKLLV